VFGERGMAKLGRFKLPGRENTHRRERVRREDAVISREKKINQAERKV